MRTVHPEWLKKKKSGINVLYSSDWHWLHRRITTKSLVESIVELIQTVAYSRDLDYLVVAGDAFDEAGALPDSDVATAIIGIKELLHLCKVKDIKLRVMEGTRSHDRGQSKLFEWLNPMVEPTDLLYIDKIELVVENDGSSWLYVPDNIHEDPTVVWDLVKEKLADNNLTSVDFIVTHGTYIQHTGLIPGHIAHNPDDYLDICNLYIDNGHIHTRSIYKSRFITNGSPGRLSHGEEEPKGMFFVHVDSDDPVNDIVEFIENKAATYFAELDVSYMSLEDAMSHVEKHCHPTETRFIKIVISKDLKDDGLYAHLKAKYPNIIWSKKEEKTDTTPLAGLEDSIPDIVPLSKDNMCDILKEELLMFGVSPDELNKFLDVLVEVSEEEK